MCEMLLVKCEKKVIKAISYSLELIVSVFNKSQRISLAYLAAQLSFGGGRIIFE